MGRFGYLIPAFSKLRSACYLQGNFKHTQGGSPQKGEMAGGFPLFQKEHNGLFTEAFETMIVKNSSSQNYIL